VAVSIELDDIHARLKNLGFKQKAAGDGSTLWKRKGSKDAPLWEISDTVATALEDLKSVEAAVAGGERAAGYAQAIEMLELLADSRERYRGGPEHMDRAIAQEVNAMRNAIKVLQGERYTAYGIMPSWTWHQFENMAERHGLELQGEPLD
jgi:hypothetical protein